MKTLTYSFEHTNTRIVVGLNDYTHFRVFDGRPDKDTMFLEFTVPGHLTQEQAENIFCALRDLYQIGYADMKADLRNLIGAAAEEQE